MDYTPLEIIGIASARVGAPRNDGTPGSALYAVPIELSRRPTPREAALLVHHWDRPSSWSTMHRAGIARVSGRDLVLDGTTVEEVRDHHTGTVKRAVQATNLDESEARDRERREQEQDSAARKAHSANVQAVSDQINFD